jgi:hypothetical protein
MVRRLDQMVPVGANVRASPLYAKLGIEQASGLAGPHHHHPSCEVLIVDEFDHGTRDLLGRTRGGRRHTFMRPRRQANEDVNLINPAFAAPYSGET